MARVLLEVPCSVICVWPFCVLFMMSMGRIASYSTIAPPMDSPSHHKLVTKYFLNFLFQVGNVSPESLGYLNRVRQRNSLGPSRDGERQYLLKLNHHIFVVGKNAVKMFREPGQ